MDLTPVHAPTYWDWHDQSKWGGNCKLDIMQSPINIEASEKSKGEGNKNNSDNSNNNNNSNTINSNNISNNNTNNVNNASTSTAVSTPSNFQIDYAFKNKVAFKVKTNMQEMQVHFVGFGGGLKIEYGEGKMISFYIQTMSFRFPAEHLINGFRLDGEILLIGNEITENNNRVIIL